MLRVHGNAVDGAHFAALRPLEVADAFRAARRFDHQISGPGEIALFGHSGSQTSQLMHSSVIIKAMAQSLCAGAHGATAPVRRFLPKLIDLVLQGKIDPGRFST